MRVRRLLFNAPPLRAMLEALLLAVILWLPLLALRAYRSPDLWQLGINLLVGPLCMLYYVLRLRVPADFLKRQSLNDTTVALLLGLALSGLVLVAVPGLLQGALPRSLWRGLDRALVLSVFSLMGDCSAFVIARLALRTWLFWDSLRRRQLLWALTHAHVMILALGAVLLILLLDLLLLAVSRNFLLLLPTTVLLVVLSIIVLAAIIPLSALVSYLVVGRVTNRLKSLAAATGLLSGGTTRYAFPW